MTLEDTYYHLKGQNDNKELYSYETHAPMVFNKHKEDELEKILFNVYELAAINKDRINEGFMTDLEVMNYMSVIIMQSKKAIVNLFENENLMKEDIINE